MSTALLAAAVPAMAADRYALVIGNNLGAPGEVALRYAEDDALKMQSVLENLGGFDGDDVTVLLGDDADALRDQLSRLNARLRAERPEDAMLLVYYSGHADAAGLHLGDTEMPLKELENLVRGSAAGVRLLVLDACRSGAITRVKGAAPAPPVAIARQSIGEGAVFLTSSAAGEDAQESDALRGSFFTHYLVSGLRGAADLDADGAVDLDEVYAYAYDHTVRASSRTTAGTQHPTFQYDLRGRRGVVLTRPTEGSRQGMISLEPGYDWLLFQGGPEGTVVAEVSPDDPGKRLGLAPGRYFVRGRGSGHFVEGVVSISRGEETRVEADSLHRLDYAQVARKGLYERNSALGIRTGYTVRRGLEDNGAPCQGALAGVTREARAVDLEARAVVCRGGFDNGELESDSDEVGAALRVGRSTDLPWLTVSLDAQLGASWLRQSFQAIDPIPPRDSAAAQVALAVGLDRRLAGELYAFAEGSAGLYLFPQEQDGSTVIAAPFIPAASAGIGQRW